MSSSRPHPPTATRTTPRPAAPSCAMRWHSWAPRLESLGPPSDSQYTLKEGLLYYGLARNHRRSQNKLTRTISGQASSVKSPMKLGRSPRQGRDREAAASLLFSCSGNFSCQRIRMWCGTKNAPLPPPFFSRPENRENKDVRFPPSRCILSLHVCMCWQREGLKKQVVSSFDY